MSIATYLTPLLIAIVTSGGTYLVTRRRLSGKIDTTEAVVMWKEANQIRRELREDNAAKEKRITILEEELNKERDMRRELESRVTILESK